MGNIMARTTAIFLLNLFSVYAGAPGPADTARPAPMPVVQRENGGTNDADIVPELSLADILNIKVVTASKSEESIDDAPNVMYVITAEQIRHRGYKSLKDVFQIIPGFGIDQRDIEVVGQVRGIAPNDNEKFALMINGRIVNQVTEPDFFQSGGFPLDNVDRIEIIVGPGGVFYGGETLCAIMNLIMKKTDYNEVAASAGGGYNTHGDGALPNHDLQGMVGKKISDNESFFASGSYYASGGYPAWRANSANSSNASLSKLDDVTGRVYPGYSMVFESEMKNWSGQFFSLNAQMPDLHMVSTGIKDARRSDYIYSGFVRNKHEWEEGFSSSFEMHGDMKRTAREVVNAGSAPDTDITNWDLSQTSYGVECAVQHTVIDRNLAQFGIQADLKQHRHNYDFQWNPDKPYLFFKPVYDSLGNIVDSERVDNMRAIVTPSETRSAGMYASDKFTVNRYLKIVGAFRLDRDNILDTVPTAFFTLDRIYFSPRLALLATPTEKLHLKLMYNRATRLAQTPQGTPLNHLWGEKEKGLAPGWAAQNPNISRPEILNTVEAQAIYYLSNARLTFNGWHQELKDYTSWFSPRTNVGNFKGNGFEYEIVCSVNPQASLWTNGAFSSNNFEATANANKTGTGTEAGSSFQLPANPTGEIMGVPQFTENLGADLRLFSHLYINPSVRYMTRQVMAEPVNVATTTAAGIDTTVIDFNYGYARNKVYCDLAVTYQDLRLPLTDLKMDVRAVVKNLLNNTDLIGTQWMADSYHPQGMTAEIGLFVRF